MAPADTPHVAQLDDQHIKAWDRFAADHPDGTFFHHSAWRGIFRDIFRLKTHYLIAKRDGAVTGILPLVQQNSILLGRGLISAPFCVEAGPLAADAPSARALDEAAKALMDQTAASYVEYRSRQASRPGWHSKSGLYATFRRPISADVDADLAAIPRKQRAVVRKALQGGLTLEIDRDPERFYPIYAASVHNLGTPVFGKNYFRALCERFGAACDIVVVLDQGTPVSAVLNFYHRGTVMPYYGGGLASARKSGANDLMYWAVMRHAAARGFSVFDFGRSKAGSGAFAFKKNWGFEPDWLDYEYWLAEGQKLPDNNAASPKYRFFVESWKRLPLPLANRIGPLLIRHLN